MIPLLAPKSFGEFSAAEFKAYIESLYQEPEKRAPLAEVGFRLTAKGSPVITVRRKPKWLTHSEVGQLAIEAGMTLQSMWMEIRRRKIEIRK